MLPGARVGCSRLLSSRTYLPGFSQALPAESSRQAIQRMFYASVSASSSNPPPSTNHKSSTRDGKTYSTAAAFAEEVYPHPVSLSNQRQWSTQDTSSILPDPPDPPISSVFDNRLVPLTAIETFRGLITTQPLAALLTFNDMTPSDMDSISAVDMSHLLDSLRRTPESGLRSDQQQRTVERALWIFRDLLDGIHTRLAGGQTGQGPTLRGTALRRFLKVAVQLNAPRVACDVFRERLEEERKTGQKIVEIDRFAKNLADGRMWSSIVTILSPSKIPSSLISPTLLSHLMGASLHLRDSAAVPRLFQLHSDHNLQPEQQAYFHLIQAHLLRGDLPSARSVIDSLVSLDDKCSYSSLQLAILRGYRALGMDENLETRILREIEEMKLKPLAGIINALIQMRLDVGDSAGAQSLFSRFDLPIEGLCGTMEPSSRTFQLLINFIGRFGDIGRLERLWTWSLENRPVSTSKLVATLFSALIRLGHLSDALTMVSQYSTKQSTISSESPYRWLLPPLYLPDIGIFNQLLQAFAVKDGFEGVKRVMAALSKTELEPDETTLRILLDHARTMFTKSPIDLGNVLLSALDKTRKLQPTPAQVDRIFADAVRGAIKSIEQSRNKSTSSYPLVIDKTIERTAPSAGLKLSHPYETSFDWMIQSLTSRGERSTSYALANRLQFEAIGLSDLSSAKETWNSLLERGFRPSQTHFIALMQGYCRAGQTKIAADMLKLAQETGTIINKQMTTVILAGWGGQKNFRRARYTYEAMKRVGFVDLVAQTVMVQVYINCGLYSQARKFILTEIFNSDTETFGQDCIPPNVQLNTPALIVFSNALRRAQDIPTALSLIAHHGQTLNSNLRQIIRQCRMYLYKILGDPTRVLSEVQRKRLIETVDQASMMLRVDDELRPRFERRDRISVRLKPSLRSKKTRKRYVDLLKWVTERPRKVVGGFDKPDKRRVESPIFAINRIKRKLAKSENDK